MQDDHRFIELDERLRLEFLVAFLLCLKDALVTIDFLDDLEVDLELDKWHGGRLNYLTAPDETVLLLVI